MLKGINGDKGLVLKDKAAHHAISSKFPTVIDNTGKTLVVQYEVKLQSEHFPSCHSRKHVANPAQTVSSAVAHTLNFFSRTMRLPRRSFRTPRRTSSCLALTSAVLPTR